MTILSYYNSTGGPPRRLHHQEGSVRTTTGRPAPGYTGSVIGGGSESRQFAPDQSDDHEDPTRSADVTTPTPIRHSIGGSGTQQTNVNQTVNFGSQGSAPDRPSPPRRQPSGPGQRPRIDPGMSGNPDRPAHRNERPNDTARPGSTPRAPKNTQPTTGTYQAGGGQVSRRPPRWPRGRTRHRHHILLGVAEREELNQITPDVLRGLRHPTRRHGGRRIPCRSSDPREISYGVDRLRNRDDSRIGRPYPYP